MGKIMIAMLARSLKISSEDLLDFFKELGLPVKSRLGSIDNDQAEFVRKKFFEQRSLVEAVPAGVPNPAAPPIERPRVAANTGQELIRGEVAFLHALRAGRNPQAPTGRAIALYNQAVRALAAGHSEDPVDALNEAVCLLEGQVDRFPTIYINRFYLLQCWEGLSHKVAVAWGDQALALLERWPTGVFDFDGKPATRSTKQFDVLRKVYKLLIKTSQADRAVSVLEHFLAIARDLYARNPSLVMVQREIYHAEFLLDGLMKGQDLSGVLVAHADHGFELSYNYASGVSPEVDELIRKQRLLMPGL